jgi:predicted metalloprotease with PDZ domain
MRYTLSFLRPAEQLIDIRIDTEAPAGPVRFFLPLWRPGRYERQAYPRYVADFQAFLPDGSALPVSKISTHGWEIDLPADGAFTLTYAYFADQTDAGGSFFDPEHIYVNPINLALYREDQLDQPCDLRLELPDGYEVAGLAGEAPVYALPDFHALVDNPFFAARDLLHHELDVAGIPVHLWFLGHGKPDLLRLAADVKAYSLAQLELFGHFPQAEYHYLYFLLPHRFRHGVEHPSSTVITLGPGHRLHEPALYGSLLEISSHEFFHTWNVKALRPADMLPYDYGQENYSRLHYVTEGVTTYYGDLMLWKSGVWGLDRWVESINGELQTHYRMGGKDFVSLEEASFDSWVNGYQREGFPNRRISFYTKGYLAALLTDWQIRQASGDDRSLDEVMRLLYHRFGREGKGYTGTDYQELAQEVAGVDLGEFFAMVLTGTDSLDPLLRQMGQYFGLILGHFPWPSPVEHRWGMLGSAQAGGGIRIDALRPDSPLIEGGLSVGDELLAINGHRLEGNLDEWLSHLQDEPRVLVHYFHFGRMKQAELPLGQTVSAVVPQFVLQGNPSPEQEARRSAWQAIRVATPKP